MQKVFGNYLYSFSVFITILTIYSEIWNFQITRWNGVARYIKATSFDGYFVAPPLFWLIVLFYQHYILMPTLFILGAIVIYWIGNGMIGKKGK